MFPCFFFVSSAMPQAGKRTSPTVVSGGGTCFFICRTQKPPVLPDVRNRAINGSADLALRRKNYEQDEKTSAFAPVQACGYVSTGADPAKVPLYISFLSHYSSKAPGNLEKGFRGPCCCHDHLRRGWICTSGIATLS